MACFRPLKCYKHLTKKTENGKALIVFKRDLKESSISYALMELPCGQCMGCRLERSRQWALRCVHEASLYENNCFITLTINEENLNPRKDLDKKLFQNFMKKFRNKHQGKESIINEKGLEHNPIRYFHCGEYGELFSRPHHHACIFNYDFSDKTYWTTRNGNPVYRSAILEDLWKHGHSEIGELTYESAAYVARYVTKKVNGKNKEKHYEQIDYETGEVYQRQPEYITMSRRPGIGKRWFDLYKGDLYPKDFITHDGQKLRPSAYYDKMFDIIDPSALEVIKKERLKKAVKHAENNTPARLRTREKLQEIRAKKLVRNFEND